TGVQTCALPIYVAGMGRDKSVFCEREDNYVHEFYSLNSGGKAEHMKVAGITTSKLDQDKESIALIDTIGEGAGVYSRLDELGYEKRAFSVKFSNKAEDKHGNPLTDVTEQYKFANMRAYCFWAVRDWLDPRNEQNAMLPPSETLMEEATEIKWTFQSNGSIIMEKKEDIKERLGRSTDEFDALAMTFAPYYQEKIQNLRKYF